MAAKVVIISKELIKPSSPTPLDRKHLEPSFLDQVSPPCFIPLIFFYQNSKPVDLSQRSRHLKQSLSDSLTKFYPLAGKVNGDLSVDCDDSGALFLEAKVDAPLAQAFKNAPLWKLNQFLPFHPFEMKSDKLLGIYPRNDILLAVQFSWFECGGNAIGVCINHAVADVMSLVSFMNSWAAASSGESTCNRLIPEPNFDSGRLLFPPVDKGLLASPSDPNPDPPPVAKSKNVSKRLLFDKEKIAELKQQATSALVKDPTRVEVVTAFLWKHFIKLARAKNETAKTLFISRHAVNVRSRISSLASDDEVPFGNFTIVVAASFVSDADQEEKDYPELVSLTSSMLRKVNGDYVIKNVQSSPVTYLQSSSGMEQEEPKAAVVSDCYFTSWNRFAMYEVDFGWGKPVLVTPAGTPAGSGVVVLMGTRDGDGIEAWVGFTEEDVALLPDELLSLDISDVFHGIPV